MINIFTLTKPYYQTSRPSTAKTHNLGISQANVHRLSAKQAIIKFEPKKIPLKKKSKKEYNGIQLSQIFQGNFKFQIDYWIFTFQQKEKGSHH